MKMICDNNGGGRARISYEEAMRYDIGFLHYLWYTVTKEMKSKSAQQRKENEAVEDALIGG